MQDTHSICVIYRWEYFLLLTCAMYNLVLVFLKKYLLDFFSKKINTIVSLYNYYVRMFFFIIYIRLSIIRHFHSI